MKRVIAFFSALFCLVGVFAPAAFADAAKTQHALALSAARISLIADNLQSDSLEDARYSSENMQKILSGDPAHPAADQAVWGEGWPYWTHGSIAYARKGNRGFITSPAPRNFFEGALVGGKVGVIQALEYPAQFTETYVVNPVEREFEPWTAFAINLLPSILTAVVAFVGAVLLGAAGVVAGAVQGGLGGTSPY
ncbi:MAG: hypothetical protein AAB036_01385 [Elusimicrobiota bacterium]